MDEFQERITSLYHTIQEAAPHIDARVVMPNTGMATAADIDVLLGWAERNDAQVRFARLRPIPHRTGRSGASAVVQAAERLTHARAERRLGGLRFQQLTCSAPIAIISERTTPASPDARDIHTPQTHRCRAVTTFATVVVGGTFDRCGIRQPARLGAIGSTIGSWEELVWLMQVPCWAQTPSICCRPVHSARWSTHRWRDARIDAQGRLP